MRPIARPDSSLRHPLSGMLGSEAHVRLMRELVLHMAGLSAPQLSARTGISPQHVRSALARLAELRAVQQLGTPQARLYAAAEDHPLLPALQALFAAEAARFDAILAALRAAAEAAGSGIEALWLYGSVARAEDRPDSDLDLAVLADEAAGPALDRFREALATEGRRLGFRPSVLRLTRADLATLAAQDDPWWLALSRDAIPVHGPAPGMLRPKRHVA